MTLRPQILLRRLVITAHGQPVYDEEFHEGINIIRGENSSGKSTITDMIFYILGGENIVWTDEAALCDLVFGEFAISGQVISLRREINSTPPPIAISEGSLFETMKSVSGWSVYGRQRSSNKESFSQFMFEHLGLPQTKSDDSLANVTMYQILRLLYVDQNTDNSSIFRRERQPFADRQDLRRSVGELLLGIDDLEGHELRLEYIKTEKLLSQKKGRLSSLEDATVKMDANFQLTKYSEIISKTQEEQSDLEVQIRKIAEESDDGRKKYSKEETKKLKRLEIQLKKQNETISSIRNTIRTLSMQLADSEVFIASLQSDLEGLLSANKSRDLIGNVTLQYCPLCLAPLNDSKPGCCPLCKTDVADSAIIRGRLRVEQELKHQIAESNKLYEAREKLVANHQSELKDAIYNRNNILSELKSIVNPIRNIDEKLAQLFKRHGYLKRLIEDLRKLEALKENYNRLEKEVQNIQSQVDYLDRELKRRAENQEERRTYCQEKIGDLTIDILHQDIVDPDSDSLQDAKGLVFSFEKDFLSVRSGRLSASTHVFLKNSFYLGLLKFAIEDDQSRLPRFFILDNIEDKGMVPERFRKFHDLLVEYTESVNESHQVILTTSYIDEKLDNTKYCVGPSYDRPPFTLDMKGEWGHLNTPISRSDDN